MAEVLHRLQDPQGIHDEIRLDEHQWQFATMPSYSPFLAGGWGSGKSVALATFILVSAYHNPPGTAGIVVLPTDRLLRQFIDVIMKPMAGPLFLSENKKDGVIRLVGDRTLYTITGHVPERIEGYTACYAGIDEPGLMSSLVFAKLAARTRDPKATWRRIGITGVPVWGWLKEEFDGKHNRQRYIIHCGTQDNTYLTDEGRASIIDQCPAYMRQSYVHGHFSPPGGIVYPSFGERNIIPWTWSRYFETVVIFDWSPRTPHVLFGQILPQGTEHSALEGAAPRGKLNRTSVVIYDEIILGGPDTVITTPALCRHVKAKGYPLGFAIGDPAGRAVEATSGKSNMQTVIRELQIPFKPVPKAMRDVRVGIEHVNLALEPMTGHPTLLVSESLAQKQSPRSVVPAFRGYSYPQQKDGKPLSDEPDKDGVTDHAMDCVRYLVCTVLPQQQRLLRQGRSLI